MRQWRIIVGLVAGAFLVLSSAAHSLLGWKVQRAGLEAVKAPADLVLGLGFGWSFAGLAMLVFGAIVLLLLTQAFVGLPVTLRPVLLIGFAYTVYGIWALTASSLDPFFLIFLVPGALLLVAAWDRP